MRTARLCDAVRCHALDSPRPDKHAWLTMAPAACKTAMRANVPTASTVVTSSRVRRWFVVRSAAQLPNTRRSVLPSFARLASVHELSPRAWAQRSGALVDERPTVRALATATSGAMASVATAVIAVFSIPTCPYCKRAKEALRSAGYEYVDIDVAPDEALRQRVREITGRRTVPQIFVAGQSVGGSDDLLQALADGSFAQLVEGTGTTPALPPDLVELYEAGQERAALEARQASGGEADSSRAQLQSLADSIADMRGGLPRREVQLGSKAYRVFTGAELEAWVDLSKHEAVAGKPPKAVAESLVAAHLVARASPMPLGPDLEGYDSAKQYMLVSEAPAPQRGEALNMCFWWSGAARPATQVANELRGLILQLYDSYLTADGHSVNYKGIRSDPQFKVFVNLTAELQKVDLAPLSRAELIAFCINLYNALIIHALVVYGTKMNTAQRSRFYSQHAKYNIGGQDYTADDLENGILRGNRSAASNLFNLVGLPQFSGGQFRNNDPRLRKIVQPVDCRIHFALVCGAKSCPPIKVYTAHNLEEGLQGAAEAFCQSEVQVLPEQREVKMSKIFKWYAIDFGANKQQRLQTVLQFLTEPARGQLEQMLSDGQDVKVSYKDYDWSLNGVDE